ncbi:hypothetical protein N2W28_001908 [Clostridium perfringens]|nr:hypothetical protein [Clostridium perfringens]
MSKNFCYENPYSVKGTIYSSQAQSDYLRLYVRIEMTEQGKLGIWRFYCL